MHKNAKNMRLYGLKYILVPFYFLNRLYCQIIFVIKQIQFSMLHQLHLYLLEKVYTFNQQILKIQNVF